LTLEDIKSSSVKKVDSNPKAKEKETPALNLPKLASLERKDIKKYVSDLKSELNRTGILRNYKIRVETLEDRDKLAVAINSLDINAILKKLRLNANSETKKDLNNLYTNMMN
jgi:hypothetical protein